MVEFLLKMNRLLLLPKQACRTHNWRFNHSTATGHYDIIISGGGMVGFAMACSLGNHRFASVKWQAESMKLKSLIPFLMLYTGKSDRLMNQKILLLESSSYRELNLTDYSPRVCALNSNSKSLLEYLGAWQHIAKARYSTVKKMQVVVKYFPYLYMLDCFPFFSRFGMHAQMQS